jgi:hypothetical protein
MERLVAQTIAVSRGIMSFVSTENASKRRTSLIDSFPHHFPSFASATIFAGKGNRKSKLSPGAYSQQEEHVNENANISACDETRLAVTEETLFLCCVSPNYSSFNDVRSTNGQMHVRQHMLQLP